MAYFNFKLAETREIAPIDVFILQLIHQNRTEDTSEAINLVLDDDSIKRLYALELIHMIKGTKKMNDLQKLRLTKKGKKWYEELQTYQTVENDFKLFETLKKIYLKEDKEIGSEKKCINLIAWFRVETGFTHREIWLIAKHFVSDETRMKYSNVLEYAFYKGDSVFSVKPKLEDSKMFNFYEKNKKWFDNQFKKL